LTLNLPTCHVHSFTHDSKAVIQGQCMVFRTVAGYARGNDEAMQALMEFFRCSASHAFLLPASSVYGEEAIDLKAWRQAPVLEVGDQVCDELGRLYEIELSSERNLNLRQITYLH
jgi:hypothetical protein